MNPLTAAVTGTAKPALVAAEDFFVQRRGVHRLIQAKELHAARDGDRVGVRGVGYRGPRPGDLIRLFQYTPAVPTDDQIAIGRRRVGQPGGGGQFHRGNEKTQNTSQDHYFYHQLSLFAERMEQYSR